MAQSLDGAKTDPIHTHTFLGLPDEAPFRICSHAGLFSRVFCRFLYRTLLSDTLPIKPIACAIQAL